MDKNKTIKVALVSLIVILVLVILIFPSQEQGEFQGSTIGKVHSVVQNSLEKSVDTVTGSAINIKETSTPVYALLLLIIALAIFVLLIKKKY